MELYLRWLSKNEKLPHEAEPLGIILCADKNQEEVELLELGQSGIHVAQYLTELPPKDVLTAKLHQAIDIAKSTLDISMVDDSSSLRFFGALLSSSIFLISSFSCLLVTACR